MVTITDFEKLAFPEAKRADKPSRTELRAALEQHALWLESRGEAGARADFTARHLEGADLVDARLSGSVLLKTNLKAADLTLADFRGATLVQANLADANLLGAKFDQADLQAADLRGCTGLLGSQLAGTNLFGATLPEAVSPVAGLRLVREVARKTEWLLCATLPLYALVWFRILTTMDSQLVKNSSALPSPAPQAALPFIPFYLFGPVAILCVYLAFHLYMQRLWDG